MKKRELKARLADLEAAHAIALEEVASWKRSTQAWARKYSTAVQDFEPVVAERDELLNKLQTCRHASDDIIDDQARRIDELGAALDCTQGSLDDVGVTVRALRATVEVQAAALAEVIALAAKATPHMPHGGSRTRYRSQLRRYEALIRPPD